jgi:plasmid stabilization system protein ParE
LSQRLSIKVARRAAAQIEEAAAWWESKRVAAPGAIYEELERAFALLSSQPGVGARARNAKLAGVRRVHLSRIHYHLYYRQTKTAVEVLAFWHVARGTGPKV